MIGFARTGRSWFVLGAIVALTIAVYSPVAGYGFLFYDDELYVTGNRLVRLGLSPEGLAWAFSNVSQTGNWHPLTWLSHMADVEIFGLEAGGHHLVNVILHAGNAILLFLVLRVCSGAFWRSALVAILFAVHPLRVESVAWVSERKDVLSTLCWILTIGAYLGYVRKPGAVRYLAVALALTMGLMAKAMLVTLPLVLLVLDRWPLGRPMRTNEEKGRIVVEKLPLFLLSAVASAVAVLSQNRALALASTEVAQIPERMANALVSVMMYLWKTAWPSQLAVFYPFPAGGIPLWQFVAAGAMLGAASFLVVIRRRTLPWLAAGWLWYLITLLPVVGLVQVGAQARADRYTYIPLIGIFLIASWGLAGMRWGQRRFSVVIAAAVIVGLLSLQAAAQTGYWRDDRTLFTHALQATGGENHVAHNGLGVALVMERNYADAIRHYRQALQSQERFVDARLNLGVALMLVDRLDEAVTHLKLALDLQPRAAEIHYWLGNALLKGGGLAEAETHFLEAVRFDPGRKEVYLPLGIAKARRGRVQEALGLFERYLAYAPDSDEGHYNIAVALESLGREAAAADHYRRALALNPRNTGAANNLRILMARRGGD